MERLKFENSFKENLVKNDDYSDNDFSLGEEHVRESDKYKQVFHAAELYLFRYEKGSNEAPYHTLKYFNNYIQKNCEQNITSTWGDLASSFFLLCWYAVTILRAPWRKTYHKINSYSGHFHHNIACNFPDEVVKSFMERLGYIYHEKQDAFLFHRQSLKTWQETLMITGMDFFVVHVRCSLISTRIGKSVMISSSSQYIQKSQSLQITPSQAAQPWKHRMKNHTFLNRNPVLDHNTSDEDDLIYEGNDTINGLIRYPPSDKYQGSELLQDNSSLPIARNSKDPKNYVSVRPLPIGSSTPSYSDIQYPPHMINEYRKRNFPTSPNLYTQSPQYEPSSYAAGTSRLLEDLNYVVVRPPNTKPANEEPHSSRRHIYHEID